MVGFQREGQIETAKGGLGPEEGMGYEENRWDSGMLCFYFVSVFC